MFNFLLTFQALGIECWELEELYAAHKRKLKKVTKILLNISFDPLFIVFALPESCLPSGTGNQIRSWACHDLHRYFETICA